MARTSSSLAMAGSWQPRGRGDMGSAEREREPGDPGGEAQGQVVLLVARQRHERVEPLVRDRRTAAVHVGAGLPGRHRAAVEQDLDLPRLPPRRAEDEVDVLAL